MKNTFNTKKMVILAMFAAIAYIVMFFLRIPSGFMPYLKYDPKDSIVAIAGFAFGPVSALIVSIVVAFIEMFTVSDTGFIGFIMNMLGTSAFACTAAIIYRRKKTIAMAIIGLIAGCIMMTLTMVLWNYLITPIYMGYSRKAVASLLAPVFLPFNLIKSSINAVICLVLYKPVVGALKKTGVYR